MSTPMGEGNPAPGRPKATDAISLTALASPRRGARRALSRREIDLLGQMVKHRSKHRDRVEDAPSLAVERRPAYDAFPAVPLGRDANPQETAPPTPGAQPLDAIESIRPAANAEAAPSDALPALMAENPSEASGAVAVAVVEPTSSTAPPADTSTPTPEPRIEPPLAPLDPTDAATIDADIARAEAPPVAAAPVEPAATGAESATGLEATDAEPAPAAEEVAAPVEAAAAVSAPEADIVPVPAVADAPVATPASDGPTDEPANRDREPAPDPTAELDALLGTVEAMVSNLVEEAVPEVSVAAPPGADAAAADPAVDPSAAAVGRDPDAPAATATGIRDATVESAPPAALDANDEPEDEPVAWSSPAILDTLMHQPAASSQSPPERDGAVTFDTIVLAIAGATLLLWSIGNLVAGASPRLTVLGIVAANLAFAGALLRRSATC